MRIFRVAALGKDVWTNSFTSVVQPAMILWKENSCERTENTALSSTIPETVPQGYSGHVGDAICFYARTIDFQKVKWQ